MLLDNDALSAAAYSTSARQNVGAITVTGTTKLVVPLGLTIVQGANLIFGGAGSLTVAPFTLTGAGGGGCRRRRQ